MLRSRVPDRDRERPVLRHGLGRADLLAARAGGQERDHAADRARPGRRAARARLRLDQPARPVLRRPLRHRRDGATAAAPPPAVSASASSAGCWRPSASTASSPSAGPRPSGARSSAEHPCARRTSPPRTITREMVMKLEELFATILREPIERLVGRGQPVDRAQLGQPAPHRAGDGRRGGLRHPLRDREVTTIRTLGCMRGCCSKKASQRDRSLRRVMRHSCDAPTHSCDMSDRRSAVRGSDRAPADPPSGPIDGGPAIGVWRGQASNERR